MNAPDDVLRARLPPPGPWSQDPRRAAVLCPLVRHDNADCVLFVVRPATLRLHPGQIAFPGGTDAGDADPAACALRETTEEVGIAAANVTLLGELPPRRSTSGYLVHCLVGRVSADRLALQPDEVERALFVPLADLRSPARWHHRLPPAPFTATASPHFEARGDLVWGLTGRLCWDLVLTLAG